jgi:hypothetical protein
LSPGMSTPRIRGTSILLGLALALLVARVLANDVEPAVAADQLAVLTNALDACPDLHGGASPGSVYPKTGKPSV